MARSSSTTSGDQKPTKGAAQKNRVHENIMQELQQRIREGHVNWLPGDRLPSITELAKEMQASTGSVREALRSLEVLNMVRIEHGSGVYVTGTTPLVELTSHIQQMDEGVILALAETRRILEPELAYLAAERGTDEEFLEIKGLARQMIEECQRGNDFAELDVMFHRKIAEAARNPVILQMLGGFSGLLLELRRAILLDPSSLLRSLRYHTLIADALAARNAEEVRTLMQGEMNCMVDEVLLSEEVRRSIQNL